jgi:glycerol uptake facilitator-like aquaporin
MSKDMGALPRRCLAEGLGTLLLLTAVVGSGIMAAKLAGGNVAVALLCNAVATGAVLTVLILIFGPVSGAHFNPAVTFVFALREPSSMSSVAPYVAAQLVGAVLGVWLAHVMFDLPVLQASVTVRSGVGQWVAEFVAAFGLVLTILGCIAQNPRAIPYAVGLYILAAYWFTASTSFANPAVTFARAWSDTFAGIAPANVTAFVIAQLAGAFTAWMIARVLWAVPQKAGR